MQQFQITLKNEKIKLYNLLSWLIIIINLTLFLYLAIFSTVKNVSNSSIASLVVFSICLLFKLYFRKTKYAFGFNPFFYILMLAWINIEFYLIAAITLVLSLLSSYSLRKLTILFLKDGISFPSFPHKKITWNKLNNAILKDGLLTIDFKNNKLIQQFIDEKDSPVNEKEFNEFCKQLLTQ